MKIQQDRDSKWRDEFEFGEASKLAGWRCRSVSTGSLSTCRAAGLDEDRSRNESWLVRGGVVDGLDAYVAREEAQGGRRGWSVLRWQRTPRLNSASGVPAWKRGMTLWRGRGQNPGSPVTPILLTPPRENDNLIDARTTLPTRRRRRHAERL